MNLRKRSNSNEKSKFIINKIQKMCDPQEKTYEKEENDEDIGEGEEVEDEDEEDDEEEEDNEEEEDDEEEDNEDDIAIIEDELNEIKKKNPELYETFLDIKEELKNTEPNIKELLSTPLRIEDRCKLYQNYIIYKNHSPYTDEWIECRFRYNHMFKDYKIGYSQYMKFSEEEHIEMKKQELLLSGFDAQLALKYKILTLNTSKENKSVIYRRYEELLSVSSINDEYGKLKHWLKWATEIPHDNIKENKVKNITEFIKTASDKLDRELFGMKKIKEQILLFLSAKIINPHMRRSNLGLVGPPGTGKTAISRMIANLLDSGFEQISFGGIDRADFLKGHEYTYVGAQPGEIVKCLKRMGNKNGIIFLDELDKAAEHPDISAALLHLVDHSQNYDFRDNFLGEISIDLSHIWYIGSMNKIPKDEALADRWWIIEVDGYNITEKIQIIENYLLPKSLKNVNMKSNSVIFTKDSINYFIDKVTTSDDKGVRTIQKSLLDIVNKLHFIITHQDQQGNLPFSTTFTIKEKLIYPIVLEKKLLDVLLEYKQLSNTRNMMYI